MNATQIRRATTWWFAVFLVLFALYAAWHDRLAATCEARGGIANVALPTCAVPR